MYIIIPSGCEIENSNIEIQYNHKYCLPFDFPTNRKFETI